MGCSDADCGRAELERSISFESMIYASWSLTLMASIAYSTGHANELLKGLRSWISQLTLEQTPLSR